MMRLSVAAGWNQTVADWQRMLDLSPGLCFGISIEDTLASTATAYIRPDSTAWIGMVLTLPEFRGRSLARQLVAHLLHILDARNIATVGLDATDMGKPLYTSLGFIDDRPIERWSRPGIAIPPATLSNREATLHIRAGRVANYLGPFTATSKESAADLLSQIPREASLYWDLFPENPTATALATSHGLTPARHLMRMVRGAPLAPPSPQTLAIEGFEFG
jgi:GNAT superfamily N-acetyltransferase